MTDEKNDNKADKAPKAAGVSNTPAPAAAPETTEEVKPRLIKYMGSADVRVIDRGEDVMGTMPKLPYPLRWKKSNNWMLDASKFPEVDPVWWDHLCENDNFKDVTDAKVKPLNEHQRTFLGMQGTPVYDKDLDALSTAPTGAPAS